jgi:protein-S-isoprenylcysteine O-methyltransferase Ste14
MTLSLPVRAFLFTLVAPGSIVVYIPYLIVQSYPEQVSLGAWRYAGLLFILTGAALYLVSLFAFVTEGKGTPAIWFARPLAFLLGKEPEKLVLGGFYTRTRNPMYLGIVTLVLGEAAFFEYEMLYAYAAGLFLFFHCVIVFIEEPHLRRKFGKTYESYLQSTHRWIGFR